MELRTSRREAGNQPIDKPASVKLEAVKGNIHFVGIGGIGMSALARLVLARGLAVSGSDKEASEITRELESLGAKIDIGHEAKNIQGAGLIAVSTAIAQGNPELEAARAQKLNVVHRSDLLRMLTQGKKVIAVSGTHGKTTTTGMLAEIFLDCGLDPDIVVGGIFERIKSNSHAGKGEYFVAEADESDRSHACMDSYIAMVTNIEPDHLENYPGGMDEIVANMLSFINHSSNACVLCRDDAGCRSLQGKINSPAIWYGTRSPSDKIDYSYESIESESGSALRVFEGDKPLGEITLNVPGEHNKLNALGACAVALRAGVPFSGIAQALAKFAGVDRRFQVIGQKNGILVIDDYGHHPTEVKATLDAAREYQRHNQQVKRIVALFQPHQPGRLRDLWAEFCQAFEQCDLVLVADIYVARGGQIEGITSARFSDEINHKRVKYLPGRTAQLPAAVAPLLEPGDLILTIGAGDITKVGTELLKLL